MNTGWRSSLRELGCSIKTVESIFCGRQAKDFDQKKQAALKDFGDKLAKLGYRANNSGRPKRSHHKKATASEIVKPKGKATT